MAKSSSDLAGLLIVDKPGLPFDWQQSAQTSDLWPSDLWPSDLWPSDLLPSDLRPSGYDLPTSHDVVQRVRRWSGQRRIGHTGTLDPMASGVLVLCLGNATRLVEYYQGHDKRYLAEVTLGIATDTYDALGAVTATHPLPPLTESTIEAALAGLRGPIEQRPPIYSALKQGGESLHRKARRGEEVTIKARQITVHDLSLVDWIEPNRLRLRVTASAGTYVRSLAHDLGEALGTVGHLSALRREAAGPFTLDDARPLDEIAAAEGELAALLLPLGWGLTLPVMQLDEVSIQKLGFGQIVSLPADGLPWPTGTLVQGFDKQGAFVGIIRFLGATGDDISSRTGEATGDWKAEKWFSNG